MPKETILSSEILRQIENIRETDIVVGIPSYNNGRTIGQVLLAVNTGLAKYFPAQRAIIVNSDGGSSDDTIRIVNRSNPEDPRMIMLSHSPDPIRKIITPYQGFSGKGAAFHTVFQIAHNLNAKACAIVDSGLKSITPEWIELLVKPILQEGYDCVSPCYLRHKFDGTITNSIVYPLTRALYGKRVRQPIGGDFGFSGKLLAHYLEKDIWHANLGVHGMDIWMTTTAIAEGYRVCESFLGPRIHDSGDSSQDLSYILRHVVGTVFDLMQTYERAWFSIQGSEPCPVFGARFDVGLDPVNVNVERMVNAFRQGVADLAGIWQKFLSVDTLDGLHRLAAAKEFCYQDSLWVKTVLEFAAAHFHKRMDRDHLIKSMTPLYLGRTASFVLEARNSTAAEIENRFELLCLEYENLKPYLMEKWRN